MSYLFDQLCEEEDGIPIIENKVLLMGLQEAGKTLFELPNPFTERAYLDQSGRIYDGDKKHQPLWRLAIGNLNVFSWLEDKEKTKHHLKLLFLKLAGLIVSQHRVLDSIQTPETSCDFQDQEVDV